MGLKRLALIASLSCLAATAAANAWLIGRGAPYVGPGDISGVSFTAWWGLRGYSLAYSLPGTNNAVRLRRASDNAESNIVILADGNLDVATADSFCASTTCFAVKIYDQVAGNACSGASCDLVQATVSRQPQFFSTGGGGSGTKPYLAKNSGNDGVMAGMNNFTPNAAADMSLSIMASRNTTNTSIFLSSNYVGGGSNGINMSTNGTFADQWRLIGCAVSATNSVWHAGNGRAEHAVVDGAIFNVDGTEATCVTTVGLDSNPPRILDPIGIGTAVMLFGEGGFQDNALWGSATRTALCHNQRLYWGTGGSC